MAQIPQEIAGLLGKHVEWLSSAAGTVKAKRGVVVAAYYPRGRGHHHTSVWINDHERDLYERSPKGRKGETHSSEQPLTVRVTATRLTGGEGKLNEPWVEVSLPQWYCPRVSLLTVCSETGVSDDKARRRDSVRLAEADSALDAVPTDTLDALKAALQPIYDPLILKWSSEDLAKLTSVALWEVLQRARCQPGAQVEPKLPRCRVCSDTMPNCRCCPEVRLF